MHYYKFNIADYRKDTTHLTAIEHYIYRQLIDWCYLDEKPIPLETKSIIRRLRLETEHEQCLTNVLIDFFKKRDDGWVHERILLEINKYHAMAEKNKKNGNCRNKKQQLTPEEKPVASEWQPTGIPNHKPRTINQEPLKKDNASKSQRKNVPFEKIIALYHKILPELPSVEKLTTTRKGYIRQRWIEDLPDLTHWENYFNYVKQSTFLMGKLQANNGRPPFRADLEWLTRPGNYAKVAEEKYHGKK